MRIVIAVIILIFNLQSLAKADGIKDVEIEGFRIGGSLLDKYSVSKIENNIFPTSFTSKKYIKVIFDKEYDNINLIKFDQIILYTENRDRNFIIQSINAAKDYSHDMKKCIREKDEIFKEMKSLFTNIEDQNTVSYDHPYDKTGNSKVHQSILYLISGATTKVVCVDFSKKLEAEGRVDHLRFTIGTAKYSKWLRDEAYN